MFADPYVVEILRAYTFFESGQLTIAIGADPPRAIVEGLRHYHRIRQALFSLSLERKKREGGGK